MPTYPVRLSGAWVMVVENDVACAAFVTEFLQEAGYGVCVVATGAQAETVLATRRPALILLDMRTSFQDWCEIVAHCLQHGYVQTPVVPMACGSGLLAPYAVPQPVTLPVQPFALDDLLTPW